MCYRWKLYIQWLFRLQERQEGAKSELSRGGLFWSATRAFLFQRKGIWGEHPAGSGGANLRCRVATGRVYMDDGDSVQVAPLSGSNDLKTLQAVPVFGPNDSVT